MSDPVSIHAAFQDAAARWGDRPFLDILPETAAAYGIAPCSITYAEAAARIAPLADSYRAAGYGRGHRVAMLLENRPDFFLHWFALNAVGASLVPINPDLRAAELEYLLAHSETVLTIAIPARQAELRRAAPNVPVIGPADAPPPAPYPGGPPGGSPEAEAALLYTSGTTGLPKGCVVSQTWFIESGHWYARMGGSCTLYPGTERMLTPLPFFHMNAMACSTMAMVMSGGCLIPLDRFHPSTWWDSVATSRATIVHCLGVMPAILMKLPPSPAERAHSVRFAFCPGPDRQMHAEAEARFGIPLIDAWAMTETGTAAAITAQHEPRIIGASCFGRTEPHMEARIVDDAGEDVPPGTPGELLVRRAGANPRYGFFTEYLKDPDATAAAWEGGWFHTGDIVSRNEDGDMYFMDRKKNVIRRSGENISAVEVEGVLLQHPAVKAVAVAAVPDALRGDEVLACIVPQAKVTDGAALSADITAWCLTRLAYYKAPGYVAFLDALPLTATNKVQRGVLKEIALSLQTAPGTIDTRGLKKRA
ncbi:MAG: AMP-binding protein [Alphaproteobacteria bacterium]|nr:AMP-binding protein [Alphaproteobacteria bacterium]